MALEYFFKKDQMDIVSDIICDPNSPGVSGNIELTKVTKDNVLLNDQWCMLDEFKVNLIKDYSEKFKTVHVVFKG